MTLPVASETAQLPAGAGARRRPEALPPSVGTRKRKRLARKLARGTVLAAGLVALQFGSLEPERERLFDVHVLDRLEVPLTHYRE